MAHRRSLGFAPPDFLLRWVALANFMRLPLRERRTRNRVQRSVAGNPGRDDKKEGVVARKGRLLNSTSEKVRPQLRNTCTGTYLISRSGIPCKQMISAGRG